MGKLGGELKAVAFDLDGTLYPNYRLYYRLLPSFIIYYRFYVAVMKVRSQLHVPAAENLYTAITGRYGGHNSFYDRQASLTAEILGRGMEETRQKIDSLVYQRWEKLFFGVRPFPRVKETLAAFRNAGLKLALLSDFPPVRKVSLLGLDGFFDVILSTEETGALKPSIIPFSALARSLELEPKSILYVGNSLRYDVEGAFAAGMKSALIRRSVFSTGRMPDIRAVAGKADFVFHDFSQLKEYVLQ
jgi:putative hydrolase of the HAD superfamily